MENMRNKVNLGMESLFVYLLNGFADGFVWPNQFK
jgi:hypothetical protein